MKGPNFKLAQWSPSHFLGVYKLANSDLKQTMLHLSYLTCISKPCDSSRVNMTLKTLTQQSIRASAIGAGVQAHKEAARRSKVGLKAQICRWSVGTETWYCASWQWFHMLLHSTQSGVRCETMHWSIMTVDQDQGLGYGVMQWCVCTLHFMRYKFPVPCAIHFRITCYLQISDRTLSDSLGRNQLYSWGRGAHPLGWVEGNRHFTGAE